jgi:hypothetical protein
MTMKNKGCGAHIAYAGLAMIALLLASCYTPKRCARVLYKCGILTDTVEVWDSIRIERVITDTLLRWDSLRLHDTVTIEQDRVRVKIVRLPGERLFVQGECKDTVIRYVRQVVNAVKRERYIPRWLWWLLFGGFVFGFWLRNRVPL